MVYLHVPLKQLFCLLLGEHGDHVHATIYTLKTDIKQLKDSDIKLHTTLKTPQCYPGNSTDRNQDHFAGFF